MHEYFLGYDVNRETPLWGNRLVQVQKNGATIAQFTFNADGNAWGENIPDNFAPVLDEFFHGQ
ncbi:MAG: hypothetical protein HY869_09475 [Chloroflexi bacterium]|nr:hypothetical protein [Chloroflexota bacterium]